MNNNSNSEIVVHSPKLFAYWGLIIVLTICISALDEVAAVFVEQRATILQATHN